MWPDLQKPGTIPQSKIFSKMHYKTIVKIRYFKKNLLNFSSSQINLILGPILKTWVPFYSLEHKKFDKSLYRLCILMFSFETCVLLAAWLKIANFRCFRKRKSFILQYAAMFDKRNIYWWNCHFIMKILVQVSAVST